MTLKRLFIQNLRNINVADINLSDRVNLIYGDNGSGKTSILEAINLLALGKSFRSHKFKTLINNDSNEFTIFGKVSADNSADISIGINRERNGTAHFKVNGSSVSSAAELAIYLPVQVINSDTFLLLEGSPKVRRQLIDWLVFHVEPKFFPLCKACQRCLKHRNSLLRHAKVDNFELLTWNKELIILAEQIHVLRERCMAQFADTFYMLLKEFINVDGINIDYHRGWDKDKSYSDILKLNYERDRQLGYTHVGSHRADLRITVNGQNVADILSRGQQKLLVCALKIAQGYVFSQITGRKTIYLVDDLPAELDEKHRTLLAKWLDTMATQVFITGVEQETLFELWKNKSEIEIKMFHVKQGKLTEMI